MNRWLLVTILFALAATLVQAQPPRPGGNSNNQVQPPLRPSISPWLNLNRRGSNPAINYYGLVQPEQQFYQSINQLRRDYGSTQAQLDQIEGQTQTPLAPTTTGHAATFQNYSHYYQMPGRSGAPGPSFGGGSSGGGNVTIILPVGDGTERTPSRSSRSSRSR